MDAPDVQVARSDERHGPPQSPIFLERQSYQRRRLIDAVRILPFVAGFLWLVPLFWPSEAESGVPTSRAVIYVFGVWMSAIVASHLLSRRLTRAVTTADQESASK